MESPREPNPADGHSALPAGSAGADRSPAQRSGTFDPGVIEDIQIKA
ncbi:hypothetical protein ElP_25610 [Tautonia plasticadhaerens]|uniref:Uncharacterized protein n=1 Tax=Tautonia plasticadhaerens TaxID=2527974 RepID=A0A518H1E9_9BACT|nr:hypothetical protein [Tautonia plasticadhaerens]QDV34669.1 hypothetical protein ElP_25610 [Tautonia plasticadhaerens]